MFRRLAFVAFSLASTVAVQAQDADAGKTVFNQCRACHQVGEGAKNLVGPHLNGLIGRKSGSIEGYSYSEANKKSGKTWDEATFRGYIQNPKAEATGIPGTKMVYVGLKDEKKVTDLVAYLKTFGADGKPAAK